MKAARGAISCTLDRVFGVGTLDRVNGRGPSGFGQRVHLTFTMQYGEEVTLSIASTTVEDHTVKCRTSGLVLIAWNFT